MKLWVLSDLHIDRNPDLDLGAHPDADVIVMAGDLSDGDYDPAPWLLETFSDDERGRLLFVSGNHEAYGIGLEAVDGFVRVLADRTGIVPLDRSVVEIEGQRFVGAPLWTANDPRLDDYYIANPQGDFRAVPGLTPSTWRGAHERDLVFIERELRPGDVVITHHAPAFDGLRTDMQHNPRLAAVSSFYFTDLEDLIVEREPVLWVHGHTHITSEYRVGGTRMVSNALGRGAALAFDPGMVIELDGPRPGPKTP